MREFTSDKGLYIIAQYLRVKKSRTVLLEIRSYLAKAGAFVDKLRRDEDTILITSNMTPEQMMAAKERAEAAIRQAYLKQGKTPEWIDARMASRVKRNRFTAALSRAIIDSMTPKRYAIATDKVYWGLWKRTTINLRSDLSLPKGANVRDHQPQMALHFQGIVEEAVAYELSKLGEGEYVTWANGCMVIESMALMVRPWAEQMSARLQIDIATGRPLLPQG